LHYLKDAFANSEPIKEPIFFTTVAPKLNRSSSQKTGRTSFSGALFWFFFGQAKKNKEYFEQKHFINCLFILYNNTTAIL
jgi:hypothetical protein